jgi:hypothetical protein
VKTTKTLCAALALCTGMPLHAAISLSTDGAGQALLFPYATIEQGNTTLIDIDNTRDRAKAIKWHVRESREGNIAASGVAYVPAKGRWSMALLDDNKRGTVFLQPGATGCAPHQDDDDKPDGILIHDFPDGEPSGVDFWPTATVVFDAVEMGELDVALTQAVAQDCAQIWKRWRVAGPNDIGIWADNPHADVNAPTGGLRGTASLVNVVEGMLVDYPAIAFNGLAKSVRTDVSHFQTPWLTDIEPESDGYIHVVLPDGQSLRYSPDRGADAISALLAARASTVEFAADRSMAGRSDIVVGLPMRSYYVGGVVDQPYNEESQNNPPKLVAPFTSHACETVDMALRSMGGNVQAQAAADLCGLATVLRVRHPDADSQQGLVADERAIDFAAGQPGMMTVDFAGSQGLRRARPDADGKCWTGLPAWMLGLSAWDANQGETIPVEPLVRASVGMPTFQIVDCK